MNRSAVKFLLSVPLVTLLIIAAGYATARILGWNPHLIESVVAGAVCAVAVTLALLPALLTRRQSQAAVAQAALIGTVVHMFLSLVLATIVFVGSLPPDRRVFLFWMLAYYWISLITLVALLARLINAAPRAPAAVATALPSNQPANP